METLRQSQGLFPTVRATDQYNITKLGFVRFGPSRETLFSEPGDAFVRFSMPYFTPKEFLRIFFFSCRSGLRDGHLAPNPSTYLCTEIPNLRKGKRKLVYTLARHIHSPCPTRLVYVQDFGQDGDQMRTKSATRTRIVNQAVPSP